MPRRGRVPLRLFLALFLAFLLSVPLAHPLAAAERAVARVGDLTGEVRVSPNGAATGRAARKAEALSEGDRIETGPGAWVAIEFSDGSTVSLGAGSALTIDKVERKPGGLTRFFLFIGGGVFRAILKPILPGGEAEIRSPVAVAAVRGTDFMGEIKPSSTAIAVLGGAVAVSDRTSAPQSVTLKPGEGTTVLAGKPPKPPNPWAAARLEALKRATGRP